VQKLGEFFPDSLRKRPKKKRSGRKRKDNRGKKHSQKQGEDKIIKIPPSGTITEN